VDSERLYRCLECRTRPTFRGKIKAHIHVAECHRHMLGVRHVDELLEQLPEQLVIAQDLPAGLVPPFYCLHCTGSRRADEEGIRQHLKLAHDLTDCLYGTDFEDEGACLERHHQREAAYDRFVATVESIDTVADFLTECDADA
jgi:hypothetical protein